MTVKQQRAYSSWYIAMMIKPAQLYNGWHVTCTLGYDFEIMEFSARWDEKFDIN